MARSFKYVCTRCGNKPHPNDNEARASLVAVVMQFKEVGFKGHVLRSRVVNWLCKDCLEGDEIFNSPERTFINKVANDA